MIRRPPRSTLSSSSAASDVYKRQPFWARREFSLGLSKPGVAGSGDVVSPVIQMSIGAPPCAVSRFITLSSSSGLATVPASTVLGDSVVVVKPGRNDRADWPDRAADMDLVVDHGACSRPTPCLLYTSDAADEE